MVSNKIVSGGYMNGDQIRLLSEIKKLIKLNKKHFKSRGDRNYLEDLLNLGLTKRRSMESYLLFKATIIFC